MKTLFLYNLKSLQKKHIFLKIFLFYTFFFRNHWLMYSLRVFFYLLTFLYVQFKREYFSEIVDINIMLNFKRGPIVS